MLVDYLGIISRDLGRELSLNDFLGTVAPELRDTRINPIVSDAHHVSDILLSSHEVHKAEFSRKHQQTLLEWRLKKEPSNKVEDIINNIFRDERERVYEILQKLTGIQYYNPTTRIRRQIRLEYPKTSIAAIKGDISEIYGIKTRIVTIFDPKSPMAEVHNILVKAIEKIISAGVELADLEDFVLLYWGINLLVTACVNIGNREYGEINNFWKLAVPQINSVLKNMAIDEQLLDNLENVVGKASNWFDASKYWLDWEEGYESD